ncbi:MAG: hypothetical protein IT364_25020 [Candidatus Hydrogenedentes bacterium]|nr:hypothetical protein [Candidatus Hydrogenedentota bacterium]
MTTNKHNSPAVFILFPAIAMLLGWGLRGYIGGGPFGALIPGCYVALSLALLLGYRPETAAMAAVFGAVGIGYGGEMTYGQTLGFLTEKETIYWGLLGCFVKGGIWGLLGGAVLGAGLTRDTYDRKTLVVAFIITIIAFYIGVKLINEPKLIYFSNREDKPRDESWAGLLFAAIAFLSYLRIRGTRESIAIPLRFALWGALGGSIGFAGGALWLAFGKYIPVNQDFASWWKMMEFTFGLLLGAAFGFCAYQNRDRLRVAGQRGEFPPEGVMPLMGALAFVVAIFVAFPLLGTSLPEDFAKAPSWNALIMRDVLRVIFGFTFFGGVAICLGLWSRMAAWHIAVTLTFFHTVLDYTRDLSEVRNFGYVLPLWAQLAVLFTATGIVAYLVHRFQRGPDAVSRLLLLVLWSCYLAACVRSFARWEFFSAPEGLSAWAVLVQKEPSIIFVHGTFTISLLITTWYVVSSSSDAKGGRDPGTA